MGFVTEVHGIQNFLGHHKKKTPWVGQNEVTGGDIFWISDYPHMIKKLRNFMNNPNYNLTYQGRTVHWDMLLLLLNKETVFLKANMYLLILKVR